MTKPNGSAVLSVFDEITALMAQVSDADIGAPKGSKPLGRRVSLGEADDYLKKLFTAHERLIGELNPLALEAANIIKDLLAPVTKSLAEEDELGALDALVACGGEENKMRVARAKEIKEILTAREPFIDFMGKLFWVEARRRVPVVAGAAKVELTADWHFVANNKGEGRVMDALQSLFGNRDRTRGRGVEDVLG